MGWNLFPNREWSRPRDALSLVECLVAVSVVALLAGLLLPAVQRVRDAASRTGCQDRLRQVGLALHGHHAAHGHFPPNAGGKDVFGTDSPESLLSWMAHILPYVEQEALYGQARQACRAERWPYVNPPHVGNGTVINLYVCTSDARLLQPLAPPHGGRTAFTSYIGSGGSYVSPGALNGPGILRYRPGMLGGRTGVSLGQVTDGTSHTLLVGERPPPASLQAGQWYQRAYLLEPYGGPNSELYYGGGSMPGDVCGGSSVFGPGAIANPCDRSHFWSLHSGGANFLFGDGSVRFLAYSARSIIPAIMTRAGGEALQLPD